MQFFPVPRLKIGKLPNHSNSGIAKRTLFATSILAGLIGLSSQGFATTVTVRSQSLGVNVDRPASTVSCSTTTTSNTAQCSSNNSDTVVGEDVTASGFASVDIVTGELKASASGTAEGSFGEGAISAIGTASISETFTVSGAGTLTAYLDVDGAWDLFRFDGGNPTYQIRSNLTFFGAVSAVNDSLRYGSGGVSGSSGSVDERLMATAVTSGIREITLTATLLTQIVSGQGSINFLNTGLLYLVASDGLTIEYSDEDFLSNPSFNLNPVPIPAALPLLLSALGFFGFFGWRRKRLAAA